MSREYLRKVARSLASRNFLTFLIDDSSTWMDVLVITRLIGKSKAGFYTPVTKWNICGRGNSIMFMSHLCYMINFYYFNVTFISILGKWQGV